MLQGFKNQAFLQEVLRNTLDDIRLARLTFENSVQKKIHRCPNGDRVLKQFGTLRNIHNELIRMKDVSKDAKWFRISESHEFLLSQILIAYCMKTFRSADGLAEHLLRTEFTSRFKPCDKARLFEFVEDPLECIIKEDGSLFMDMSIEAVERLR